MRNTSAADGRTGRFSRRRREILPIPRPAARQSVSQLPTHPDERCAAAVINSSHYARSLFIRQYCKR